MSRISTRTTGLIVKSAVKDALSWEKRLADFYDALGDEVTDLLEAAAALADANDRKTV